MSSIIYKGKQEVSGGVSNTKDILQSSILSYISFDSGHSQDDGCLNTDFSGTGSIVDGKVSNCYQFNGSQYIQDAKNKFNFSSLKEYTLSFWFNPSNNTGFGVPLSKGSGSSISLWEMHCFHTLNSDNYGFYIAYNSSNFKFVSWDGFAVNNWWHTLLKLNISEGKLQLKVNNDIKQTVADFPVNATITSYANSFKIGARADLDFYFNGKVDEVCLFNRWTSDIEDSWLYNLGDGNSLI